MICLLTLNPRFQKLKENTTAKSIKLEKKSSAENRIMPQRGARNLQEKRIKELKDELTRFEKEETKKFELLEDRKSTLLREMKNQSMDQFLDGGTLLGESKSC